MRLHLPAAGRRAGTLMVAVTLFVVLAGTTYQGVATALERRQFRHPGRLIDVGGHQLHIYCTGEGSPTVILEAGAASMSAAWGGIQSRIARSTRVCSYDRAGLGWSEAGDRPFTPSGAADDLAALLNASKEQGPLIVVGRGLGATFAQIFAARHTSRTAALVLIDAPDADHGLREGPLGQISGVTPWLARVGIRRAMRSANVAAAGLPEPWAGATRTFLYRPDHLARAVDELAMWRQAVDLAAETPPAVPSFTAAGDADAIVSSIEAAITRSRARTGQ